ncbi:MAG: DUF3857 and transglutaminase domain-containing protein [Bacteroidales bacterium]|nr:DUF3857 and transglutaminase domain-containing protein [Bacteroidales bacterium]
MKKYIIFISITLLALPVNAFEGKPPIKWNNISQKEFLVEAPSFDRNASAVILCDFGEIEISNRTFYKRHVRIKILNEKGLEFAKVVIPYNTFKDHDDIMSLRAQTYNLKNGKIIKSKVTAKEIQKIQSGKNTFKKQFIFPDVKVGSIIEYSYTIASLDFIRLKDWVFQHEIPTLWSEIRMSFPRPFMYLVTFQRGPYLSAEEKAEFASKLQWLYDTKRRASRFELAENNYVLYKAPQKNYTVYVINDRKKKIVMRNLPGVKSHPDYIAVSDYVPKIKFQLFESSGNLPPDFRPLLYTTLDDYNKRSKFDPYFTNDIAGYVHYRLETYQELNDRLLKSKLFGFQLVKHLDCPEMEDNIVQPGMTDLQKMISVYDYVKTTMKWDGIYADDLQRDLSETFKEKTGHSGEVNMVLINLLRRTGLKANPVLIRTNDMGQPETVYPVNNQFNHVIAEVTIGGEMYLLDAIDPARPYNIINEKDMYTHGWLVTKENYGWISLFPNNSDGTGNQKRMSLAL